MEFSDIRLATRTVRVLGVEVVSDLATFLDPLVVEEGEEPAAKIVLERRQKSYICDYTGDATSGYAAESQANFLLLLERTLLNLFLEYIPEDTLVFHASGFYTDGCVVGFLGEPDAGKTTVATEYMTGRGRFVSDELIAVRPEPKTLYPFPKPLNLDPGVEYSTVRPLDITDTSGKRFRYGLPNEGSTVLNDPTSFEELHFYGLNRRNEAKPELAELEKGESFLQLRQHLLRPRSSSRAFNRLSDFFKKSLKHHELTYSDSGQLPELGLIEP